jgi:hypothetical protein
VFRAGTQATYGYTTSKRPADGGGAGRPTDDPHRISWQFNGICVELDRVHASFRPVEAGTDVARRPGRWSGA